MNKSIIERTFWVVLLAVGVYAPITGTNWHRNYQEAMQAEAQVGQLEIEKASLIGTIEQKDAEIARLKAI